MVGGWGCNAGSWWSVRAGGQTWGSFRRGINIVPVESAIALSQENDQMLHCEDRTLPVKPATHIFTSKCHFRSNSRRVFPGKLLMIVVIADLARDAEDYPRMYPGLAGRDSQPST